MITAFSKRIVYLGPEYRFQTKLQVFSVLACMFSFVKSNFPSSFETIFEELVKKIFMSITRPWAIFPYQVQSSTIDMKEFMIGSKILLKRVWTYFCSSQLHGKLEDRTNALKSCSCDCVFLEVKTSSPSFEICFQEDALKVRTVWRKRRIVQNCSWWLWISEK